MYPEVISRLRCAHCCSENLTLETFGAAADGDVREGVIWCADCRTWYPIEDGLLDMLIGGLAYHDDRARFWHTYESRLTAQGLVPDTSAADTAAYQLQRVQQEHFDRYSGDGHIEYLSDFEIKPFWVAADKIANDPWRQQIQSGTWLLDVGSANGRSTFKMADLDINILGFDVSKHMIRQAIDRYRAGNYRARASFMAADGMQFPLRDSSFDYVLIYGVLHHMPDPDAICKHVGRVLKPGGLYFGHENNQTIFRPIFELLQKVYLLWHEEAGPEALISQARLREWFAGTGVTLDMKTTVFVPPHLINLTNRSIGYQIIKVTDTIAQHTPLVKDNGGIILIQGKKSV
ncbi:MAG: methyltransferase domain-containing protein [Anaerolineae bacterium]|nr:methyltransferase domain-containing protein [Anaerolineae bacterium]